MSDKKSKTIAIYIKDLELLNAVRKLCEKENRSLSSLIQKLLKDEIARQE